MGIQNLDIILGNHRLPMQDPTVVLSLHSSRLSSSGRDPDSDVVSETTAEDRVKISAIDWLLYDPQQRSEALRQANALIRTFLVSRKIGATRVLFNKVRIFLCFPLHFIGVLSL